MDKRIVFITQTAVMLALLIGIQFATRPFGQFVTGSLVNLVLLVSTFMIGTGGGLIVAASSPFLAFFAGIGAAFIQIVPFMAIGNAVLVLVARLVRKHIAKRGAKDVLFTVSGLIAASAAKMLFLWIGIVVVALPLIPGLKEQQIAVISAAFTWPQAVTALIGSALAMAVMPLLKKAVKR